MFLNRDIQLISNSAWQSLASERIGHFNRVNSRLGKPCINVVIEEGVIDWPLALFRRGEAGTGGVNVSRRAVDYEAASPENLVTEVEGIIKIKDSLNSAHSTDQRSVIDHVLRDLELVEIILAIARALHRDVR